MHLKGAGSLNGMLDLGYRLHSMPAVVDMSHMARCGPHLIAKTDNCCWVLRHTYYVQVKSLCDVRCAQIHWQRQALPGTVGGLGVT